MGFFENKKKTYKNNSGYLRYKDSGKFVHIAVAEKKVGGKIYPGYQVHHKDGNKTHNSVDNIAVLKTGFHQKFVHKKKSPFSF